MTFVADKLQMPVAELELNALTRANVVAYQDYCLLVPHSPKTINMRVAALQSFASWFCEYNPHLVNPLGNKLRLPEDGLKFSGVDPDDVNKLIKVLQAESVWTSREADIKHHRMLLAVTLMLSYGVRIGAVSSLRMQDIRDGRLHFITKGQKAFNRKIIEPVAGRLAAYLEVRKDYAGNSEWVLTTATGGKYTPRQIRRDLTQACDIAGIEYFNPHKLRHTYARTYLAKTNDIRALAQLLGHGDLKVTMVYTEREQDELEATAEGLFT